MISPILIPTWLSPLYYTYQKTATIPPHICSYANIVSLRSPNHTTQSHPIIYEFTPLHMSQHLDNLPLLDICLQITNFLHANPQCRLSDIKPQSL